MPHQSIYGFSGESCDWKGTDAKVATAILGGKGAGLVKMAQAGMPVPPGFTITTEVCNDFAKLFAGGASTGMQNDFWSALMDEVTIADDDLKHAFGFYPLVAVRSGAPVSMPGMMDTILNVGITDDNLPFWEKKLGARAALDSYRRLIQMLGATAFDVPMKDFDSALNAVKAQWGVKSDTDLSVEGLEDVIERYKLIFTVSCGKEFPSTRHDQMLAAIKAVFSSWMNPRAITYRELNGIDEAMGTACTVQSMVFGNMGDTSATGVLFSRSPSTGENAMYGEFLINAQGEDVVAGVRTPVDINTMASNDAWYGMHAELIALCYDLEVMYRDMVDIEFTVQEGKLYVLQSRKGKRSALAAFQIAVDMVANGFITKDEALSRITPEQYKIVSRPMIDPSFKKHHDMQGLPGCPGVAMGKAVFSSAAAVASTVPCILVTHETNPNDIAGMAAAAGILTQTGGATSHAAVVARGMDKPCVVGCTELVIPDMDVLTDIVIDGATGRVWIDTVVPMVDSSENPAVKTVIGWCMEMTDKVPLVSADLEGAPCRISTGYWHGSDEALQAVLTGLAACTEAQRGSIILDISAPDTMSYATDNLIGNMFCEFDETGKQTAFIELAEGYIEENEEHLKGLWVLKHDTARKVGGSEIMSKGELVRAAPVDYIVYSTLAQHGKA